MSKFAELNALSFEDKLKLFEHDPLTAHRGEMHYQGREHDHWELRADDEESPYAHNFRQCSYCGSIHPGDLFRFILEQENTANPIKFECADLKYGWPHKFYISNIKNAATGKRRVGSRSLPGTADMKPTDSMIKAEDWTFDADRGYWNGVYYDEAPEFAFVKFYSIHLQDVSEDGLYLLAPYIMEQTGWGFAFKDGKFCYGNAKGLKENGLL